MINTDMREYEYYTYGGSDAYGQPTLLKPAHLGKLALGSSQIGKAQIKPAHLGKFVLGSSQIGKGQNIKIALYTTSQAIQNNIAYNNASYVGLTHDSKVNDTYVIRFGEKRLKVLYVQQRGRYKQVFMEAM